MESTTRWSPFHGYALVVLLGASLAAPVLLSPRSASAQRDPASAALAPAGAAPRPERRLLTVQGTADVTTTPDEVTIHFRIESFDRSLKAAKKDNDGKARAALALIEKHGIAAGAVQTGDFTIQPRHDHTTAQRTLLGYDVVKQVTVARCSVEQADLLLQELFEGGANALEGVSFAPSKVQEKRAEARKLAVQAARQKAEVMAAELGQRLGPPVTVNEQEAAPFFREYQSNLSIQNESAPAGGPTLAAGKMKVQSSVSVVFELLER